MTSTIEDLSALSGEKVCDQDGARVGVVKDVYGVGEDRAPAWVTVEISTGIGRSRLIYIPVARLKHEQGEIRAPYSSQHLLGSPEIDGGGELSEAEEEALRAYYAIGMADQELRTDNDSYAAQVPDGDEQARRLEDSDAR